MQRRREETRMHCGYAWTICRESASRRRRISHKSELTPWPKRQRMAQARQDWDRERAQTQSSPTGFQLAYVKNPNAYWNVQRPSTRPPSARFVPPFPSVVSVTSAPRQALSSTSQASQDGRVSPAAGAGAANLARPGGGASAAVVPLAANLGAASAVGAMQTSTATTVNRGLAPNSTAPWQRQ